MDESKIVCMFKRLLKHMLEIVISFLHNLTKNYIYTARHGLAKGLKRKGGLGFLPKIGAQTQEESFLIDLDLRGQTVYDIGGNVGVFTLFFSRAVGKNGRVVVFEPHPENYKKIIENVRLNKFDNVEVRQIGLGEKRYNTTLAFSPLVLGEGSVLEDTKACILQRRGAKIIHIEIDSLDNQIIAANILKPDLVKIDVEGFELDVLLGMSATIKNYKPKLFIEIHGIDLRRKVENIQKIVDFLNSNDYSVKHVESRKIITPSHAHEAPEGHLYCT